VSDRKKNEKKKSEKNVGGVKVKQRWEMWTEMIISYSVALYCFSKEIFIILATSDDTSSMLNLYIEHQ
jgi:hypothetical protein